MKSEDSSHLKTLLFIHPDYTNPHAFFRSATRSLHTLTGLYSLEYPNNF